MEMYQVVLRGRDITSTDDDDDNRGGGDGMPLYARLGYPSQQAYMAAMQRATQAPAGLPAGSDAYANHGFK